jgi:hypothetical protein
MNTSTVTTTEGERARPTCIGDTARLARTWPGPLHLVIILICLIWLHTNGWTAGQFLSTGQSGGDHRLVGGI